MKKYLARDHKFFIKNLENWIQISGITSWSISYAREVADLSKFNDLGWSASITTSRAGSINLEGFYLTDISTGDKDLGQLLCDQAANGLGYNGLRAFKIEVYDDNNLVIGSITCSGVISTPNLTGGNARAHSRWNKLISLKSIPVGAGIYNIFSQESYPPPEPDISRSGMWTGVLGMYTYAE